MLEYIRNDMVRCFFGEDKTSKLKCPRLFYNAVVGITENSTSVFPGKADQGDALCLGLHNGGLGGCGSADDHGKSGAGNFGHQGTGYARGT